MYICSSVGTHTCTYKDIDIDTCYQGARGCSSSILPWSSSSLTLPGRTEEQDEG